MATHFAEFVNHEAGSRTESLGHVVVEEFLDDVLDFLSTLTGVRIGGPDVLKFGAQQLCGLRNVSGDRLFSGHDFDNNYSSLSFFRENMTRSYLLGTTRIEQNKMWVNH